MALNKQKTDPALGKIVQDYLISKGVDTPLDASVNKTEKSKITTIAKNFTKIMNTLGLDLRDDSLNDTPNRVAKMFVNEIFWGLDTDNFPKVTTVSNKMKYDEMVLEKNINVSSNCEHHFVAISGKASVAYIPKDKVLGLSKLNRIVEYFSKRPQIQERLTEQIFYALEYILETSDIAVVIDAEHLCVKSRGVEDTSSSTITSKLGGAFKEHTSLRNEFMSLIK